jgi:hypothetical protein
MTPLRARPIMPTTVTRLTIRLALLSVLTAVSAATSGCNAGGETVMPEALIGTWTTTAPAYADRALRFTRTAVVFGADVGIENSHPVQRVMSALDHDTLLYTVVYTDLVDQEISFYYTPGDGGTITLKNQREFQWKRKG